MLYPSESKGVRARKREGIVYCRFPLILCPEEISTQQGDSRDIVSPVRTRKASPHMCQSTSNIRGLKFKGAARDKTITFLSFLRAGCRTERTSRPDGMLQFGFKSPSQRVMCLGQTCADRTLFSLNAELFWNNSSSSS